MPPVTKEMLEARAAAVRTGGPGSVRRHVKTAHKSSPGEDKKVLNVVKRLGVMPLPDVDEVTMLKSDKTQLIFKKPKVQTNQNYQCFVVSGNYEQKELTEADMLAAQAGAQQGAQMSAMQAQMAQLQQLMAQNPELAKQFAEMQAAKGAGAAEAQ